MLVKEKLRQKDRFSDVEGRIAAYILEREEALEDDSVRQIAARLYVAPSSVVRFCRKLGYDGFADFKDDYLKELHYLSSHFQSIDPNFPFEKTDREMVVANKMAVLYEEIIRDCQMLLTPERLKAAMELLGRAKEIYLCASGAQLGIVEVFRDKMMKIGRLVHICSQTDEAFYQACYCSKESCFIIISYTGETARALRTRNKLKERGIPVLAVTSYGSNSLSAECDCCLYVSTREKLVNNLGSFGINVSVMYLLDVLYANYFNRDYDTFFADKVKNSRENESGYVMKGRHSSNPILEDGTF